MACIVIELNHWLNTFLHILIYSLAFDRHGHWTQICISPFSQNSRNNHSKWFCWKLCLWLFLVCLEILLVFARILFLILISPEFTWWIQGIRSCLDITTSGGTWCFTYHPSCHAGRRVYTSSTLFTNLHNWISSGNFKMTATTLEHLQRRTAPRTVGCI